MTLGVLGEIEVLPKSIAEYLGKCAQKLLYNICQLLIFKAHKQYVFAKFELLVCNFAR